MKPPARMTLHTDERRSPSGRLVPWVCDRGHRFEAVAGTPAPTVCPVVVHGRVCDGSVARAPGGRR